MYVWLEKMQKAEIKEKEQADHEGEGQEKV